MDHDPVPMLLLNTYRVNMILCVIAIMGWRGKGGLDTAGHEGVGCPPLDVIVLESVAAVTLAAD